jgi:hypothetical protein
MSTPVCAKSITNDLDGIKVSAADSIQRSAQKIQGNLPFQDTHLQDILNARTFSEKELLGAMDTILKIKYTNVLDTDEVAQLKLFKKDLVKSLKGYDISGFSFCVCPNKGFIKDTQYPEFSVVFKNNAGDVKTKNFQGEFVGYGLKIQLAFKFDFIFFVGTDVNFFDAQEPIELGGGFEFALAIPHLPIVSIECTYVSFKKHSGGMIIIAPIVGIGGLSLSYIAGGTLTPVE